MPDKQLAAVVWQMELWLALAHWAVDQVPVLATCPNFSTGYGLRLCDYCAGGLSECKKFEMDSLAIPCIHVASSAKRSPW